MYFFLCSLLIAPCIIYNYSVRDICSRLSSQPALSWLNKKKKIIQLSEWIITIQTIVIIIIILILNLKTAWFRYDFLTTIIEVEEVLYEFKSVIKFTQFTQNIKSNYFHYIINYVKNNGIYFYFIIYLVLIIFFLWAMQRN